MCARACGSPSWRTWSPPGRPLSGRRNGRRGSAWWAPGCSASSTGTRAERSSCREGDTVSSRCSGRRTWKMREGRVLRTGCLLAAAIAGGGLPSAGGRREEVTDGGGGESERYERFFVALFIPDDRTNDLDKEGTLWTLHLVRADEMDFEPVYVRKTPLRPEEVSRFIPYAGTWYRAYEVAFPKEAGEKVETVTPASRLTPLLYGAQGR